MSLNEILFGGDDPDKMELIIPGPDKHARFMAQFIPLMSGASNMRNVGEIKGRYRRNPAKRSLHGLCQAQVSTREVNEIRKIDFLAKPKSIWRDGEDVLNED